MNKLNETLAAIKARCEAATPGPWEDFKSMAGCAVATGNDHDILVYYPTDAEFIAHARTDIPKLLAVIDKLKRQRNSYMELFQLEDPVNHPPLEMLKEECEEEIDRILNGEGET